VSEKRERPTGTAKHGRLGTCVQCGETCAIGAFGRIAPHSRPLRMLMLPCIGAGRFPKERGLALRKSSRRRRSAEVEALRADARVVLDAVLDPRYAPTIADLFPGRLHMLIRAALMDMRLQHDVYFYLPWRSMPRDARPRRLDLYCTFCGDLMTTDIPEKMVSKLIAHLKRDRTEQMKIEAREGGVAYRIRDHYEVCALQCLAGMKPYKITDTLERPRSQRVVTDEDIFDGDSP
jgi:hypothetical protein